MLVQIKTPGHLKTKSSTPLAGSIKSKQGQENDLAAEVKVKNIQDPSLGNSQPDSTQKETQAIVSAKTPGNIDLDKKDSILSNSDQDKVDKTIAEIKKIPAPGKSFFAVKWGLNVSGGFSKIAQNSFLHSFLDPTDKSLNSSSYNNPGAINGGGGGPAAFTNPQSPSHSSFAFKAGLTASKNFSKRSNLSIGIQYAYLSDKFKTGYQQINNALLNARFNIPAYYSGTAQQTFTDHFHFIELPVIYDWRITGKTTHFLSVDAGASFSYLISTNALVYDTVAQGIYYHNKDQFNRGSINLISGFSYHARKKSFELIVGPRFTFSLQDIFKSNMDQRRYFLYSGIEASMLFGKNKKK
jgi:hypothetical protein